MTPKQDKFYWRLWKMLKTARPESDRKAVHRELGLGESHTSWGRMEMDRWIGHCLAVAQPANYKAQRRQAGMEAMRGLVTVRHYLTALELTEAYAEGIVAKMNRGGALGGKFVTLETLEPEGMEKVMIAIKKEAKRRWPRKEDLLEAIEAFCRAGDFEERAARAAVAAALNVPVRDLIPPRKMDYERLLVVLSALRRMANGKWQMEKAETPDWSVQ